MCFADMYSGLVILVGLNIGLNIVDHVLTMSSQKCASWTARARDIYINFIYILYYIGTTQPRDLEDLAWNSMAEKALFPNIVQLTKKMEILLKLN